MNEYKLDDDRLRAYYSPFRKRSINPDHFDNKMVYWCNEVLNWCKKESILKFSISDLKEKFELPGNMVPLVFDEVSNELLRRGKIISEKCIHMRHQDDSWVNRGVSLVVAPIKWTFSVLYNVTGFGASSDENYVELSNLQSKCKSVQNLLEENSRVLSDVEIYKELNKLFTSFDELSLALRYLSMKNCIHVKKLSDGVLIFKSNMNNKDMITSENISVWRLGVLQNNIQSEVLILETSIQNAIVCIKESLAVGFRLKAKTELVKKKKLEVRLKKKYGILDNIETLLMNIGEASSNKLICDVFKESAGSFQEILSQPAYSIDSVADTIDHLQDLIRHKEDIDEILVPSNNDDETSELEKELDQLLLDGPSQNAELKDMGPKIINDLPSLDDPLGCVKQKNKKETLITS